MPISKAKILLRTATVSVILLSMMGVGILNNSIEEDETPVLVLRIDDIQDFAFKEAQLFLLQECIANNITPSLAVIAGFFGKDEELVQTVKLVIGSGGNIITHGWKHEDLSTLPVKEQAELLA